jgi:DNA-binding response OmpR family regulator
MKEHHMKKLLVLSNDHSFKRLLELSLKHNGFKVSFATSSEDAWKMLKKSTFDLVKISGSQYAR